ncbi:splicing factor 3B subunit 2 [Wolbachia endosymbiont (group A) of Lasioglossum malachurum]|uniref:splicing factor 3B subunit 2 n=1 Tax=Wolbachia endosymbiont (group A) of Lasioglossum malachurum TaxID=2954024 RepID=UPI0021F857DE|nr:splicing factor 3B subunit 2 [Wolbachia endosymbiont (group A) of Lasioglossum malachurum]
MVNFLMFVAKRAQERCHSSAPFFVIQVASYGVIPVPRHWDPVELFQQKYCILR